MGIYYQTDFVSISYYQSNIVKQTVSYSTNEVEPINSNNILSVHTTFSKELVGNIRIHDQSMNAIGLLWQPTTLFNLSTTYQFTNQQVIIGSRVQLPILSFAVAAEITDYHQHDQSITIYSSLGVRL